jgi:hypothetical protein
MSPSVPDIKRLLPRGAIGQLSAELGLSYRSVALALRAGKPGHRAVQRAMEMAAQSGALATAQALASLPPRPNP